jgi:viroplasmin and RNaseH domain-containing protein
MSAYFTSIKQAKEYCEERPCEEISTEGNNIAPHHSYQKTTNRFEIKQKRNVAFHQETLKSMQ